MRIDGQKGWHGHLGLQPAQAIIDSQLIDPLHECIIRKVMVKLGSLEAAATHLVRSNGGASGWSLEPKKGSNARARTSRARWTGMQRRDRGATLLPAPSSTLQSGCGRGVHTTTPLVGSTRRIHEVAVARKSGRSWAPR